MRTEADTPDIQSLDVIRSTAEQALRERAPHGAGEVFVKADALDSRLRLAPCHQKLVSIMPATLSFSARQTVGVRCPDGSGWTVYVAVAIETELQVYVLRGPAARGAHVVAADVEQQVRRVAGFANAYVTNLESLGEQHVKRPLPAGSLLVADVFAGDVLIRRGQQVTLITQVGGIEVRAMGAAITEGGIRDRVRVQNLSSLKVVEGVVETASVVRIGG